MRPCYYSDFLTVLKNSTHNLPREFIILATKNIECRIAFFVYLLLLDLATQPEVEAHTICIAQRKIAKFLNISLRTIKRAIAFLNKNGYIAITREHPKKGGYQLNQIQVLFPEPFVQTLLQQGCPNPNAPEPNNGEDTGHPILSIEELKPYEQTAL